MYYLDGVNTFRADEQLAIDLLLNKHEEIPDDLRTQLEYYKKIREQQEAEKWVDILTILLHQKN